MEDFQAFCVQKELNIGFFNVGDFSHRIAAKAGVHSVRASRSERGAIARFKDGKR